MKKTRQIQPSLPIGVCYKVLLEIATELNDWKNIEANEQTYTLKWEWRGGLLSPKGFGTTSVLLRSLNTSETVVAITAENKALADPFGILERELLRLVTPFRAHATLLSTASNYGTAVSTAGMYHRCPMCHHTDRIAKVSAVVTRGIYNVEGTTVTGEAYRESRVMPLSDQLKPPAEPTEPHGIGCRRAITFWGAAFSGGVAVLCIFGIVIQLVTGGYFQTLFSPDPDLVLIVTGLLTFGILGLLEVRLYQAYSISSKKERERAEHRYAVEKAAWERQHYRWEHAYYCERDDVVFDTSTGLWCYSRDFENFLIR